MTYALSYRNIEEMMAERGVSVDHSTISKMGCALCPRIREAIPTKKQITRGQKLEDGRNLFKS